MQTIPVFCGKDCGGNACPLTATLENGRVTHVANNVAAGKYLLGCSRGYDMPLELYAPDRLLRPLIRTGARGSGRFREASWDEALDLVADRLGDVRAKFGAASVLNLASAGCTSALHGTIPLLRRFLNLYGGATRFTGSYSNGAAQFILPYLFGDQWKSSGFDAATMQYAEMIVLWGANVLGSAPGHGRQRPPARSRPPRRPDRGHRPATVALGAQDRRLVDPLPPRDRRRADAGGASCAADRRPRRSRLRRGPQHRLRAA